MSDKVQPQQLRFEWQADWKYYQETEPWCSDWQTGKQTRHVFIIIIIIIVWSETKHIGTQLCDIITYHFLNKY